MLGQDAWKRDVRSVSATDNESTCHRKKQLSISFSFQHAAVTTSRIKTGTHSNSCTKETNLNRGKEMTVYLLLYQELFQAHQRRLETKVSLNVTVIISCPDKKARDISYASSCLSNSLAF